MADVDAFIASTQLELARRIADPDLAQRIENVRFTPVRLREGYDMADVDAYLDLMRDAALAGR